MDQKVDKEIEKQKQGRPLAFKSVKELQAKIDEYFDFCNNRLIKAMDKEGNEIAINKPAPYTMSGLARRVGLSRQGLLEYSRKDGFSDAIREARQRVEEDVEQRMMETRNEKGAMFSLKNNFKWHDEPTSLTQINTEKLTLQVIPDDNQSSQASV